MNAATPAAVFTDYKVADITLADFGRREITLAEADASPYGLASSLQ